MITSVSKPSITVKNIELQSYNPNLNQDIENYWTEKYGIRTHELGREPLLWYNGIYIPPTMIDSLVLSSGEFTPSLQVYFKDETSELINTGFALDNTIISLYIDSRTKDSDSSPALRPIRMDFKITEYAHLEEENMFYVEGLPNVDGLFLQKIKSYPNMTSFDCLHNVAQSIGLGFRSNVSTTNDAMTWLNLSLENHAFIKDVTKRVYKSENSFFTSFIDFYYSLNLIDIDDKLEQCHIIEFLINYFLKKYKMILSKKFLLISLRRILYLKMTNLKL